jgi:hypothetical protein
MKPDRGAQKKGSAHIFARTCLGRISELGKAEFVTAFYWDQDEA